MATLEQLQDRVEYLEAVEGARRTIQEYLQLHDLPGRVEDLIRLFAEDATLEISGYGEAIEGTLVGRQNIGDLYRRLEGQRQGPATGKHITTNIHIEIDGDEATAISYLGVGAPPTDKGPGGGIYQERLRREPDGRWRFTKKRIIATDQIPINEALVSDL